MNTFSNESEIRMNNFEFFSWMGAVDPPFEKSALFEKKSNNIILNIFSLRTSHVYTCLNFTYSA